ncbi:MAG: hypothetical protein IIZ93_00510 [Acidaminococcaceae bacterium]|nr:hypothetical protein [Acidaminococcaceae bacterium]
MIKNIIRECDPETAELSFYFDNDGLTEKGGDYCYNLFIVMQDRHGISGFNTDEYKRVKETAENILEGFSDVDEGKTYCNGFKPTYKSIMQDEGLSYNPTLCHKLREWAKAVNDCTADTEAVAAYLTVTTGKTWATSSAYGYCQGDYVQIVYCKQYYPENVEKYGEIWLGAAKEFCVIDLDENGEEGDSCWGYIVADCETRTDADYKRLVCEQSGIKPEETRLEMINGYHTYTKYEYRTA